MSRQELATLREVETAHDAALKRKQGRRNVYRTYSEAEELQAKLDGRQLERVSLYAPEWKSPESAGDWWDDVLLRFGCQPNREWAEFRLVAAIAVAARDGGEAAAVTAVRAARELSPAQRSSARKNLVRLRDDGDAVRTGADRVIGAALAEWDRLGLTPRPHEVQGRR